MGQKRKFIIFGVIIISLLAIGGVFYWKNQEDIKNLNAKLPEGIKVTKTLTGKYRVTNKIDGYEFTAPKEWNGIKEIKYIGEWKEKGYKGKSINLQANNGISNILAIDQFQIENWEDFSLESWAKKSFENFGLVGEFQKNKINGFEVVKTKESAHLLGMYVYFFKKGSFVYAITGGPEESIKEIIINGRW